MSTTEFYYYRSPGFNRTAATGVLAAANGVVSNPFTAENPVENIFTDQAHLYAETPASMSGAGEFVYDAEFRNMAGETEYAMLGLVPDQLQLQLPLFIDIENTSNDWVDVVYSLLAAGSSSIFTQPDTLDQTNVFSSAIRIPPGYRGLLRFRAPLIDYPIFNDNGAGFFSPGDIYSVIRGTRLRVGKYNWGAIGQITGNPHLQPLPYAPQSISYRIRRLWIGPPLIMTEAPLQAGASPPRTSPLHQVVSSINREGQYLGAVSYETSARTDLSFETVPYSWIQDNWEPFRLYASTGRPFFFSFFGLHSGRDATVVQAVADRQVAAISLNQPAHANINMPLRYLQGLNDPFEPMTFLERKANPPGQVNRIA